MGSGFSEPSPRWAHFSAVVEGQVYTFGGRTKDYVKEKSSLASTVHLFNPCLEFWQERRPEGTPPPPGLYDGGCASVGHCIYFCGSFYGTVSELNTSTLTWSTLSTTGPTMKYRCRMISHDNQLLLFGGYGVPSGPIQPGAKFVKNTNYTDGSGWNNELHAFCLKEGTWSSPDVTGTRPPPCSDFSLTRYDDHHAVLFGGYQPGRGMSNDVYLIDATRMHWRKTRNQEGEPCPEGRSRHGAVCLGYGNCPQLLITGGLNKNKIVLSDAWMLDLDSGRWREVKEPHLQARCLHSASAFCFTPGWTEVTLFGGCPGWPKNLISDANLPQIANTTVLRFEQQQCDGAPIREWVLTDLADSSQLGTHQRVEKKVMKIWRMNRVTPTSTATPVAASGGGGSYVSQALRDAERRAVEAEERAAAAEERSREAEREKEIADIRRQKAEASQQEAVREQQSANTKRQEAEERSAESEERMMKYEERLQQLEAQWVLERREIQLTGAVIGRGAWATVSVAKFRGVRVAAKFIHHHIISPYNLHLFRREMDMASRIRHPNLLQFIGATLEGEMVILTELMPTSLRRELEREIMSSESTASIGLDVVRALNYLHQMRPHPLIHRDISSSNVLLEPLPNSCWRAKVSDYGTVNLLQQMETVCPGNPCYAAPEANDPTQQSTKMDIFSFGVLLMEMLTGEFPASEQRARLLRKIYHQPLLQLIRRCLQRKREDRPNASDIITELDQQ